MNPTPQPGSRGRVNIGQLLSKYRLEKIRLNLKFVSGEIVFNDADADAAWELYVEMLTRIVTQPLPSEHGDEKTALDSVYALFPTTREILRRHGRNAVEFSKVAVPVLNQVVRPFTAKWHREALLGAISNSAKKKQFRDELKVLQTDLRNYNRVLAEIAGVEDLTDLEATAPDH